MLRLSRNQNESQPGCQYEISNHSFGSPQALKGAPEQRLPIVVWVSLEQKGHRASREDLSVSNASDVLVELLRRQPDQPTELTHQMSLVRISVFCGDLNPAPK